jgi:hypothetical protein
MPEKSVSFREWFNLWPSVATLAEDMGVPANRAHQWVARGSLQTYYWRDFIVAMAERHGLLVTLDDLIDATCWQREQRIQACIRGAKTRKKRRREAAKAMADDAEAA